MRIGETVVLWNGRLGRIVATIERHGRVTGLRVRLEGSGRVVSADPESVEVI